MKIVKMLLAIIAGIIAGSLVNGVFIFLGNEIFGSPKGMILWDEDSVKAHADQLTTANYVCTFLAHQLGTFVGALVAAAIAPLRKVLFALVIGIWFLGSGIYAASIISAPVWFAVADIVLYLPTALFGSYLAAKRNPKNFGTEQR